MSDILFIHPDEQRRADIGEGLADYGHDVVLAQDYIDGAVALQQKKFDAVVCDTDLLFSLPLPRGSRSFVSMIRSDPSLSQNAKTPVIALGRAPRSRDYAATLDTSCSFPDTSWIHEVIGRVLSA